LKILNKQQSTILLIIILTIGLAFYQSYRPSHTESVDTIKVMTYNVHLFTDMGSSGQNNLVEIAQLIKDAGADIIGLQESEGSRMASSNQYGVKWLADELNMYYYFGPSTHLGVWGVSLLSRWEILNPRVELLPSEGTLQRVAIVAEIDIPSPFGKISVIVTHLSFDLQEVQLAQAEKIVELAKNNDKTIAMGDFNTVIAQLDGKSINDDPTFVLLNNSLVDSWVESGGAADENTSFHFSEAEPDINNTRIDYIWYLGDFTVIIGNHQVLGDESVSDHRAILVEFTA